MLLYNNRSFFRVILAYSGSVFWRADNMFLSLALAAIAVGLQTLVDLELDIAPKLPHHYGMLAFQSALGFAVVFRMNFAWQRYWEAVSQLHIMYSKWGDAYSQIFAFSSVTIARAQATPDKCKRVELILQQLMQNFSLMSAIAVDRLSHGDTQRMEKRAEMCAWNKQIAMRKELCQEDLTGSKDLPVFEAAHEEGCESSPSSAARRAAAASGITNQWSGVTYMVREVPEEDELEVLQRSTDRASVVMYWIVHDLATVAKDLETPPPIQSRAYQELSNGMLGFNQALKVADVPFPFPYAQLLTLVLTCYSLCLPVYIVCFTDSVIMGPVMTFLVFQGIWGINETAKELENPFGPDENDITVSDFHYRFMDQLQEIADAHKVKMETVKKEIAALAAALLPAPTPGAASTSDSAPPAASLARVPKAADVTADEPAKAGNEPAGARVPSVPMSARPTSTGRPWTAAADEPVPSRPDPDDAEDPKATSRLGPDDAEDREAWSPNLEVDGMAEEPRSAPVPVSGLKGPGLAGRGSQGPGSS